MEKGSRGKFIYVSGDDAKEKMLERRLKLLKYDEQNHISVFLNRDDACFDGCGDIQCAYSDTLTF